MIDRGTEFSTRNLLADSSKMLIELVIKDTLNKPDQFSSVVHLALYENMPYSSRASRVVYGCARINKSLIYPYIPIIIRQMEIEAPLPHSMVKLFAEFDLPMTEREVGILLNYCFLKLTNPEDPMAVKAYSIDCLLRLMRQNSEIAEGLMPEFKAVLKDLIPVYSPGLRGKVVKILKQSY